MQFDVDVESVRANLARIRDEIGTGVRICAATKYLDAAQLPALREGGIVDFGENRLDAMTVKVPTIDSELVTWHYIGRLQSRKVSEIAALADVIHTLSTDSSAAKLASLDSIPEVFVQVNTAADPTKDGILPADLLSFLDSLPDSLSIAGLMTMPAFAENPEDSRRAFSDLRELLESGRERFAGRHSLTELSMGTSQDYAVAVQEGATVVRLGAILYASVQPTNGV